MTAYRFVILGGGMVAGYAAKELVEHGLRPGELRIISSDDVLPYERPPLSKGFLAGAEEQASILISDAALYAERGIDVHLSAVVESVDLKDRRMRLRSGEEIGFEKLLIATGAQVRTLEVPGARLDGILYLRSLGDSRRIRAQIEGAKHAVVIGSGFIGMEVAAVLSQKGLETTMLFPDERVWQRFFTPEMSAFFQRYYEDRGVSLMASESIAAFEGNGQVSAVVTGSGQRVAADLVVAGIGVAPATRALEGAGLELHNGVVVNEYLETGVPNIYAAGDVANYRDLLFEKQRRVEHWDNAVEQGKHAAHLLMGERAPFIHVPYFFSDLFDLSYEFWGDAADADQVVYRGEVSSGSFSTWWLQEGRLVAAFVMNRPDQEREVARLWIAERYGFAREELQDLSGVLRGEA